MRRLPLPEGYGALYACAADGTERDQHTAAHALLREAVQDYAAAHGIALEHPLTLSEGKMGKPYFAAYPNLHFNLSHCRGLAVCLLSDRPCGVDAEQRRPLRPQVVRRVFSETEQEQLRRSPDPDMLFTRMWTLKEAYVKAIGVGVSYPMRGVCFAFEGEELRSRQEDAEFWNFVEDGFSVSACVMRTTCDSV